MARTRLSDEEVAGRLAKLSGWELVGGELRKTYVLKDFSQAMLFVGGVALLAEAAGHHPDLTIRWNKVTLALTTHDAGGLTDNDFRLAEQIDALPRPS